MGPSAVCTAPGSKPVTATPVRTSIEWRSTAAATSAAMSGSRVRMTSGAESTSVTSAPHITKASAISSPM